MIKLTSTDGAFDMGSLLEGGSDTTQATSAPRAKTRRRWAG
jgi:hypothetical protein